MRPRHTPDRVGAVALLAAFALMIALPLFGNVTGVAEQPPMNEYRVLAPAPGLPRTLDEALAFPASLTAAINDHYGFRNRLVPLEVQLRYQLFGEFASDQVLLGLHDRLFLTSHLAGQPFMLFDYICGTSVDAQETALAAEGLSRLFDVSRPIAARTYYLSIPTSPIIYHEDVPGWLAQRCDAQRPFVPRLEEVLARLHPDVAPQLIYPRQVLMDVKARGEAFASWDFHWSGLGARAVVEAVGDRVLAEPRRVPLTDVYHTLPSDLAQFMPGLEHEQSMPLPDHAAAGMDFCERGGGACDPAFAPFDHVINEMSEAHWRHGRGPSLLIVSDSFGRMAAQYFGEYFADVLNLNIGYDRLRPGDLEGLAAQIASRGKPDVLLYVFHDAAARDSGGLAGPMATVAAAFAANLPIAR